MADFAGEKTHDPTPHRRRLAREAGQVARSHDLVSAAILLAGVGAVVWLGNSVALTLRQLAETQLGGAVDLHANREAFVAQWRQTLQMLTPVVLPLLGIVLIAAVLANLLQVGAVWLPQRLAPDWNRINPLSGWQRIFSISGLTRLAFGVLKVVSAGTVAAWSLRSEGEAILSLAALETLQVASVVADLVLRTSLKVGSFLLLLALFDYGYQWWKHEQSLKMTAEELREEMRNLQGDPQIATRRRKLQRDGAIHARGPSTTRIAAVRPVPPS